MDMYHDQVIEAAYLHSKPRCYYIGPFARRVSFASQQHRALDLVAALSAKKKLGKGKSVAVVGAGVAGLTMTAALRGQGCRVHLYEREQEPLLLQKGASHRLIHPTISRWPAEVPELTTNFPFFDWFAAPCDRVISSLRAEWEERLAPDEDDHNYRFIRGVTVTGLVTQEDRVFLATTAEDQPAYPYDYAFITTGYGEEDSAAGVKVSYWTEDEIDRWRQEQREVYVSGCGDGGLIDSLRLVHADFDRGWLAVRLAHLIPKEFHEEILDAEHEALMAAKSLACMDLGGEGGGPERKVGSRYENDDIVRRLTAFYRKFVERRLPVAARTLLEESLEKAGVMPGRVNLVSRQVDPFGPYAAPIHKIMVQHALAAGRLRFRQGELSPAEDGIRSIDLRQEREQLRISDEMRLVVRHGSPANLTGLASKAEMESLRIRQFMLADYIYKDVPRLLLPPKGYPDREEQPGRYIGIRRNMVQELVDALIPGATVTATAEGFFCERPTNSPPDRIPLGISLPEKAFGLRLDEGDILEIEAF